MEKTEVTDIVVDNMDAISYFTQIGVRGFASSVPTTDALSRFQQFLFHRITTYARTYRG